MRLMMLLRTPAAASKHEIRVLLTVSASEGKADSKGYGRNSVGSV